MKVQWCDREQADVCRYADASVRATSLHYHVHQMIDSLLSFPLIRVEEK